MISQGILFSIDELNLQALSFNVLRFPWDHKVTMEKGTWSWLQEDYRYPNLNEAFQDTIEMGLLKSRWAEVKRTFHEYTCESPQVNFPIVITHDKILPLTLKTKSSYNKKELLLTRLGTELANLTVSYSEIIRPRSLRDGRSIMNKIATIVWVMRSDEFSLRRYIATVHPA